MLRRITFCQEQELDLENEVSATVAQPPGTLFLPTATTLLTPVKGKGKVFPYSLPSVGPGADPDVQAVSPQVT